MADNSNNDETVPAEEVSISIQAQQTTAVAVEEGSTKDVQQSEAVKQKDNYHLAGYAGVKKEFLLVDYKPKLVTDYMPEDVKKQYLEIEEKAKEARESGLPPCKKLKLTGQNKHRPHQSRDNRSKLCPAVLSSKECRFGDKCKFTHDLEKYMENKPEDLGKSCYQFETTGFCSYSVTCRYGSKHITPDFKNKTDETKYAEYLKNPSTRNSLPKDLQNCLRKRNWAFPKSDTFFKEARIVPKFKMAAKSSGAITDEDIIKIRPGEKKTIDFRDKLYLAPLTTVGNLPFRRICKEFGVDITCGEMAMATNILQGHQSEWALLKRHSSEDLFGVQLCGGHADSMTRCAELLTNNIDIDFIDINCGCPIDLVYKKGEGSALMGRPTRFEQIVKGMTSVMDGIPLTVKIRTGISEDKSIAHTLIPKLRDWGVSMCTLHGRSREQRYTKAADWNYINMCSEAAKPMTFFGNGDILSYEDANLQRAQTGVDGIMIARGALIKPWIFQEIKEQKHIDISANERFDMLKSFVNYGLQHWGSDQQGIDTTRRFLLEWLSFLFRYIPLGVLESVPQKINQRPPFYHGRNDLETLMSSSSSADWVKISEMLLGPVPDGFTFLPKHKANAYK